MVAIFGTVPYKIYLKTWKCLFYSLDINVYIASIAVLICDIYVSVFEICKFKVKILAPTVYTC